MIKSLAARNESVAILSSILLFTLFGSWIGQAWFDNLPSMLRDISWLGIVAIGQSLLIISGEFDLSVGSVFAFAGLTFVLLLQSSFGVIPAFLLALALGIFMGYINGVLSWKMRLPSMLVTLGFLFFYRGLVHYFTNGFSITLPESVHDNFLIQILGGKSFGYHNSIAICALVLLASSLVLARTRFGSHLYAVGGDIKAAMATGIPVAKVKILAFVSCSVLAGVAGIIAACTLNSVSPTTAEGLEFEAIAATVIAGCSLRGGAGSAWGTVLGVATLMALKAGLILIGTNIFVYQILLGTVLVSLIAVKGMFPKLFAPR